MLNFRPLTFLNTDPNDFISPPYTAITDLDVKDVPVNCLERFRKNYRPAINGNNDHPISNKGR